jgi:RimJ/RimL family protein N-acetyltransferase
MYEVQRADTISEFQFNCLGQQIGYSLPNWTARKRPPRSPIEGRLCRLEPLDPDRHAADLHAGNCQVSDARDWTYLPYGPFERLDAYRTWANQVAATDDPLFHTIIDRAAHRPVGIASLMRIDPANGVIEVGHIKYTPALQRTAAATEAMYLLMRRVFDELGYRRYEWKCDALNSPSRAAAVRLGFMFEGIFRQASVYKSRNRDTAWYSIIDREWPALKSAYERWLAVDNFDAQGRQRRRLGDLIAEARGTASR